MPYDADTHQRRSIRLSGFDYAGPAAHFITICAYRRRCVFGKIVPEEMQMNALGEIVREEWLRTPGIRPGVEVDAFVVMPNHIHGIVVFTDVGAHCCAPLHRPPRSLGSLVAQWKATTTRRVNALPDMGGARLWQRNYYDHVIRSDEEWAAISAYIEANPALWTYDRDNLLGDIPRQRDLRHALSAHGLAGRALDFIINYDLRYRTETQGRTAVCPV